MANRKFSQFTDGSTNQVPADELVGLDQSQPSASRNTRWTLNNLFAYAFSRNVTDQALRWTTQGSAPALSAAGEAALYYNGTALQISYNGGAFATLGAGSGTVTNSGTLTSGRAIIGNGGVDVLASRVTVTNPATTATLTLADNSSLITSGANSLTLTTTGATNVTLPTSGTLATLSNNLGQFAATTSAQLAGVISDETGSGALVFATSPTLVTPTLGAATAISINGLTLTASTGVFTLTNAKTLSVSNTLTLTGTDGASVNFGAGGTVLYSSGALFTLNAGANTGLTAPGAITQGSTVTFGAATDNVRFGSLGLGGAAGASNTLRIYGGSSGSITFAVPAAAGSNTLTFPAGTTDFSATGGANQVVQQASAGSAFTVGQLAASNLSNGTTGTGAIVLANTPTLITPSIGAATGTSLIVTSTLRGIVQDLSGAVFNVKAYGATGDGVTDDTTAVQAAITAATAAGGGTIYFPQGTYILSNITIGSSNKFRGAGKEATTLKRKNATTNNFITAGGNNILIIDLTVDGNSANSPTATPDEILLSGNDNIVERVRVEDWKGIGIEGGLRARLIDVEMVGTPATSQYGIWIAANTGVFDGMTIVNPVIRTCRQAAIYLGGVGITVINPTLIDNHQESAPSGGGQIAAGAAGTFQIIGGFIGGASGTTVTTGPATSGIELDLGYWEVLGTEIAFQSQHGIILQDGAGQPIKNAIIRDVRIYNCGANAITVNAGVSSWSVIGARCYDTQGSPTQAWGLRVEAGASNNYYIIGCNFSDNVNVAGLSDLGTGTSKYIACNLPNSLSNYFVGSLGIGTTAPTSKLTVSLNAAALPTPSTGTLIHLGNVDGSTTRVLVDSFGTGVVSAYTMRSARGTAASPTATQSGDQLGNFGAIGRQDSSNYASTTSGQIRFLAASTFTSTDYNTDIAFFVVAPASTTLTERLRLTGDGRLYGTALHNNSGAVTGTTNQYIASGTYTPTLTNVANVAASTAYACQWMRVGNVVTVSGKVDVDPTLTATSTQLGISLPIASNFTADQQCSGAAFASGIASQGAAILGDTTNDRAQMQWISGDITNQPMYFSFTYVVL